MTSLTEKMARSMCESQYPNFNSDQIDDYWEEWIPDAKAALAVALEEIGEECAKVADRRRDQWSCAGGFGGHSAGARIISDDIRARVAEMKSVLAIKNPNS